MMSNVMDFGSLAPVEVPVKIDGKDYVLREASGDAAAKYRNAAMQGATIEDGKVRANLSGLADSESLLVSLCLYYEENGVEKNVKQSVVKSWPTRIIKPLYEKARDISELNEEETEESIESEISKLQEKLLKLREDHVGNGSGTSQGG